METVPATEGCGIRTGEAVQGEYMNAKTERNRSATRIHRGGKHLENRSREKPLRKRIHAGLARNEATKGYAERGIPAQDSPQYAVGTTDEPRAEVWRGLPRSTGRETGRNESGLLFRQSRFFDAGADLFPAGPGRNAFENEQAGAANLLADTRMGQIARRTNAGPMLFIETTGRLRFGISFTQGDRRPGVALDRNATDSALSAQAYMRPPILQTSVVSSNGVGSPLSGSERQ